MIRSLLTLGSLVALLSVASGVAFAAPKKPRTYALREVLIEGNVTPEEKKKIDEDLIKRFMLVVLDAGTAIEPERVQKLYSERPHLRECREKNCLVETGDYLAVDRLISVVVEKNGAGERADWEVRMMLFAVDAVKYTDKQTMPCKQCTLDEVMRDFGNTVIAALKLDRTLTLCTVSVATAPPGGQVLVDGEPVGLAPFEHTIEAGKRTIGARSDAAAKNELEIECPPRERRAVTFKLDQRGEKPEVVSMPVAAATSSGSGSNAGVLKGVGGAMIGVGVLGFVGAGVAGAYNGKGTCDSGNCPFLRDTRGLIAGFAIGGTVFAGIGIGLVVKGILDSKRGRVAPTSWIVAPQFGAQSVGAVGQFHY